MVSIISAIPKRPVNGSALRGSEHPGEGGDLSEVSAIVALMLAGIGVVSFITANIAAYFVVSDQESDLVNRLWSLEQRQERIEASIWKK